MSLSHLPGSRVAFAQQKCIMARLHTRQDKAPFRCQSRDGLEREFAWSENPLQLQRGCGTQSGSHLLQAQVKAPSSGEKAGELHALVCFRVFFAFSRLGQWAQFAL